MYTSTIRKARETSFNDELVALLKSSDATHPLILHEIAQANHHGVALRLVARFSATSTIRKIAGRYGIDLASGAVNSEIALLDWMQELLRSIRHHTTDPLRHMTVFSIARQLRDGWGVGTPEGLTTVNPLAGRVTTEEPERWNCTAVRRVTQSGQAQRRFYRGSRTEARTTSGSSRAVIDTSTLSDIRAMMALWSQFPVEGPLRDAISNCVWVRSGFHARDLEDFFPRAYGGTAAHRLTVHDRVPFDLACSPRVPSQLLITTDGMNLGDQDLPIAIQENMLFLSCWMSIAVRSNSQVTIVHHVSDLEGVPLVNEDPVSDHQWTMRGAPVTGNPILTAPHITIDHAADENISSLGIPITGNIPRDYACTFARILGTLGKPGRINAITSGVDKIYSRDAFDKSEVHALNPITIIRASVQATIVLGIAHTLVAGRVYAGRIGVQTAFTSCARVVTSLYWEHFRTGLPHQEWMTDNNVVAPVGEHGLTIQQDVLADEIASRAMQSLLTQPKDRIWRPFPIAASGLSKESVTRLVLASALAKDHAGRAFGQDTTARAIGWLRDTTRGDLRHVATQPGCLGYAAAALLRGRGVLIIGTSPAEALRWIRGELFPHNPRPRGVDPPHPEWCITRPGSGVLVPTDNISSQAHDEFGTFTDAVDRSCKQTGGLYTKAVVAVYDCIPPGKGAALCVGFGQGGSAAALAMSGYTVTGLDLIGTIPDDPIAIRSFAPPEVTAQKLTHTFRLSPLVYQMGGDWVTAGTMAIAESEPNLIYLGIERGGEPSRITDLLPVRDAGFTGVLVVRVLGDQATHDQFASVLSQWGQHRVERPPTCRVGIIAHHVVTIIVPPEFIKSTATPARVVFEQRRAPYTLTGSTHRVLASISRLLFGSRAGVLRMSLRDAGRVITATANDAATNSRRYIPRSRLMSMRDSLTALSILEECAKLPGSERLVAITLSGTPHLRRVVPRALGMCLAIMNQAGVTLDHVLSMRSE